MRAACITALRSHFGVRAITGFMRSNYAAQMYPGLEVGNRRLTKRENYNEVVRRASVCVATSGLHGSVPWKMGEYVALGKAIVSQSTNCRLPGDFQPGRNYLSFSSADECVAEVEKLFAQPTQMVDMMAANVDYYDRFLRPDKVVLNSLVDNAPGQLKAIGAV
jgi:hypothetical protein